MGSFIAESTIAAGAIALVAAGAGLIFGRRRPALLHLFWLVVLVRLAVPPLRIAPWPRVPAAEIVAMVSSFFAPGGESATAAAPPREEPPAASLARGAASARATPVEAPTSAAAPARTSPVAAPARDLAPPLAAGPRGSAPPAPAIGAAATTPPGAARAPAVARPVPEPIPPAAPAGIPLELVLLAVSLAGTTVLAARWGVRAARFRRVALAASPAPEPLRAAVAEVANRLGARPVEARVSHRVSSACIFALGRPILLWPASEIGAIDRGILAHEIAHLRRRDHIFAWIEIGAGLVLWWHPLVAIARRELRRFAELACDAWAVWAEPAGRRAYAEALIRAAERQPSRSPVLPALSVIDSEYRDLERRLVMILRDTAVRRVTPLAAAAVVLAALFTLPSFIGARGGEDEAPRVRTAADHPDFDRPSLKLVLEEPAGRRWLEGDLSKRIRSIPGFRVEPAFVTWDEDGEDAPPEEDEDGMDLFRRGDFERALEAFLREAESGDDPGSALYNAACACAQLGRTEEALEWLEKAIDSGYRNFSWMRRDDDLEPLRGDRRFERLTRGGGGGDDEEAEDDGGGEAGIALLKRGEHKSAASALEREARAGGGKIAFYNLACALALLGQTDRALESLANAVEEGWDDVDWMQRDDDLASLRGDKRFAEITREVHGRTVLRQFGAESWRELLVTSEARLAKNADDGAALSRLGWACLRLGDYARAREAFERQARTGHSVSIARYNAACASARMGDIEAAFAHLEGAFVNGLSQLHHVRNDADLFSLHGDPRWDAFIRKMRARCGDCECDREPAPTRPRREVI